jgi:predicted nucleic acid-binding Zn ribbon protein
MSGDEPVNDANPKEPIHQEPIHQDHGRSLLDRARQARPVPRRRRPRKVAAEDQPWSGAGADGRDPAALNDSLSALVADRKWDETLRTAGIPARWDQIVGSDIAAHCVPDKLEDGVLTIVAESTAWATNLTLLSRTILDRLASEVGAGVVRRLHVHGPTAPDWRHGRLRVTGRGPRDTYG